MPIRRKLGPTGRNAVAALTAMATADISPKDLLPILDNEGLGDSEDIAAIVRIVQRLFPEAAARIEQAA